MAAPSTRILYMLLGSQVYGAKTVVRSAITIDADGSAHPFIESHITDHSRISMAVSPVGALELSASTSADALLREVEDMMRSNSTPDNRTVRTIKEIVEEVLLPGLDKDVLASQNAVSDALAAIGKCNTTASGKMQGVLKQGQADVEAKGADHTQCRAESLSRDENLTSHCESLKESVDNVARHVSSAGEQAPDHNWEKMAWADYKEAVQAKWVPFIKSQTRFWCSGYDRSNIEPKIEDKLDACNPANGDRVNNGECDYKQVAFEGDFCTWVTQTTDTCDALTTCYDDAKKSYESKVLEVKQQGSMYRAQFEALHKILCYVEGWMADGNLDTFSQMHIEACLEDQSWKTKYHISYGAAPGRIACPPESAKPLIDNYPGTVGFETDWYNGKDWSKKTRKVQPCLMEALRPAEAYHQDSPWAGPALMSTEELNNKKASVLRKIAVDQGATHAELEACDDSENTKKAFVALIHRLQDRNAVLHSARRSDLHSMKASALRKIATGLGASAADIEACDDADDTKRAFINLIHRLDKQKSSDL